MTLNLKPEQTPQTAMTGGPGDPISPPVENTPVPEIPTQVPQEPLAPAASQIIIGNRVFQSKFEADNYLADLEARTRTPVQAPQGYTPVAVQDPSDILFEDPKAALKMFKDSIREEIRNEGTQERSKKAVWDDFYRTNPDLVDYPEIVQMQFSKLAAESPHTPVTTAMPSVAAQARVYLSRIRGVPQGGQPLRDGPSRVAGASGAPAPVVQVPAPAATNFLDELKAARKSRNG